MFGECSVVFKILIVMLCAGLVMVPRANGICCRSTEFTFQIRDFSNLPCSSFEGAGGYNYIKRICFLNLCGSFRWPTPCCGRGPCNIFCCNCDNGCHRNNSHVRRDFVRKHYKLVTDVRLLAKV